MAELDPFTQVMNALWAFLEDYPPFASLVKLANRIKLQGDSRTPRKSDAQDADMPEVEIVPAGGEVHLFRTNQGSSAVQQYEIRGVSGDLRTNRIFFPLKWALVRAVVRMGDTLGIVSPSFKVTKTRVMSVADAENDEMLNRGTEGWSCRLLIACELWFNNETLLAD